MAAFAKCMWSLVPSIAVLGPVAFVALQLSRFRLSPAKFATERATASHALGLATAVQCAHFAEEWATDFHVRFPALFGLEPMPLVVFVVFNLTWIAIWIASIPLLRSARKPGFFAAWFLAIAGMLNGIAHPLMALASSGYFPGLVSSPFIGLVSIYLWWRLQGATLSERS